MGIEAQRPPGSTILLIFIASPGPLSGGSTEMWFGVFAAAICAVYVQNLHGGCVGGDSGELMAMVCSRGVPHPPGYPLLMIIGQFWLFICPRYFGSPAWRLSLLSAIFGSCSCWFIASTARICCGGCIFSGLLAGGIWAFSDLTWKFSTHFEVFSLNNFLCSILIYLTVSRFVFLEDTMCRAQMMSQVRLLTTDRHTDDSDSGKFRKTATAQGTMKGSIDQPHWGGKSRDEPRSGGGGGVGGNEFGGGGGGGGGGGPSGPACRRWEAFVGAAVCGAALANQHTAVLLEASSVFLLLFTFLSVCQSVSLSVSQSVSQSVSLSVCLPACLPVCLSNLSCPKTAS